MPDDQNATEAARRKADELDVDIHSVAGTGSGGRVTVEDVANAPDPQQEPEAEPAEEPEEGGEKRFKVHLNKRWPKHVTRLYVAGGGEDGGGRMYKDGSVVTADEWERIKADRAAGNPAYPGGFQSLTKGEEV